MDMAVDARQSDRPGVAVWRSPLGAARLGVAAALLIAGSAAAVVGSAHAATGLTAKTVSSANFGCETAGGCQASGVGWVPLSAIATPDTGSTKGKAAYVVGSWERSVTLLCKYEEQSPVSNDTWKRYKVTVQDNNWGGTWSIGAWDARTGDGKRVDDTALDWCT